MSPKPSESTELAVILGAMLKAAPVEDDFEYRFMFDLTANTFLQKLIPKRLMDRKLPLSSAGFLKSLLVLDFFAGVLAGEDGVLDNLAVIGRELAKRGPEPRISTEMAVVEIGLYAREKGLDPGSAAVAARFAGGGYGDARSLDAPAASPGSTAQADPSDAASLDCYYEGMGFMLLSQMDVPSAARCVRGVLDYKAAVFAGAVRKLLPPADAELLAADLANGLFLNAAVDALRRFCAVVTLKDLESRLTAPGPTDVK